MPRGTHCELLHHMATARREILPVSRGSLLAVLAGLRPFRASPWPSETNPAAAHITPHPCRRPCWNRLCATSPGWGPWSRTAGTGRSGGSPRGAGRFTSSSTRAGMRDRWRRAFRGSPAAREFFRLQWLQKAGIPAPRAVALLNGFTLNERRGDAVILEAIEPSTPLDVLLTEAELEGREVEGHRGLAEQVIEIVHALGKAGLGHEDLHLGNFLVQSGKVYLIDAYAVRRGGLRQADVLHLGASVRRFATTTDLLRGWRRLGGGDSGERRARQAPAGEQRGQRPALAGRAEARPRRRPALRPAADRRLARRLLPPGQAPPPLVPRQPAGGERAGLARGLAAAPDAARGRQPHGAEARPQRRRRWRAR